jgi:hypothetical protein
MARHRNDLGERKQVRVDLHTQGFLIPAPDAPWIECTVIDVSDGGARLEVGAMAVPEIFGFAFTARSEVLRVCSLTWRRTRRCPFRQRQRAPGRVGADRGSQSEASERTGRLRARSGTSFKKSQAGAAGER